MELERVGFLAIYMQKKNHSEIRYRNSKMTAVRTCVYQSNRLSRSFIYYFPDIISSYGSRRCRHR